MKQLLAEDEEEMKKTRGAAKSTKTKRRNKKARKKRGASDTSDSEARVEDSGDVARAVLETMPTAERTAAHAAAPEPVAPFIEVRDAGADAQPETTSVTPSPADEPTAARPVVSQQAAPSSIEDRATAPVPVAIGAATTLERPAPTITVNAHGRGRGGRGLAGRGARGRGARGRGSQRVQSTVVAHAAHLLGQASLQVPTGSSNTGAAAPIAATALVALDWPPPMPAAVTSLAQFDAGRPESTIGGQTTCIICFSNPKTHAAVPCGHWCACGHCSAQMAECPVCRNTAPMWLHVHPV